MKHYNLARFERALASFEEAEIRRRQTVAQPADTLPPRELAPSPSLPSDAPPPPSSSVDGKATTIEPGPAAASSPIYKRWWLWTAVAGVVVGVGDGVGLAVGGGSDAPVNGGTYGWAPVVF